MATLTDGFAQYTTLRQSAGADTAAYVDQNDPETLREVASQFEALFIETLMQNMRAGQLAEPLFGDSDQHAMYEEMMDQQLAKQMSSGRGLGLADMLVRQLGGTTEPGAVPATNTTTPGAGAMSAPAIAAPVTQTGYRPGANGGDDWSTPDEFARGLWPHANHIAERLGLPAEGIVAQAALETGWGQHVMQRNNGVSSYNLFGIKAGGGWKGATVTKPTVEYVDGVAEMQRQRFRAYPDVASAFEDYAALIENNPRYSDVKGTGSDGEAFARALQSAGYATDPAYATKISRLLDSETIRGISQ